MRTVQQMMVMVLTFHCGDDDDDSKCSLADSILLVGVGIIAIRVAGFQMIMLMFESL